MNFVLAGVPFLLTALVAGTLAALVFYHGPGKRANRALATMLLGTAAFTAANAMAAFEGGDRDSYLSSGWVDVGALYEPLMLLSAIPLALSWPAPRAKAGRALAALSLWAALALTMGVLISDGGAALLILSRALVVVPIVAATLLALEARRQPDASAHDAHVLMALGLSLAAVYAIARYVGFVPRYVELLAVEGWGPILLTPLLAAAALVLIVSLWRARPSRARTAARALTVTAAVSGVLDSALYFGMRQGFPFDYEMRLFLYALWILVPTALLAFVVLSGQVPGLDVKVRFALSRSTLAAGFVAAFFLASEGAQLLLGQGNAWIGLLGAGALVFAMAPLQRAAERLADRVVPPTPASPRPERSDAGAIAGPGERREDVFRRAATWALREGRLSRAEEIHLHELALHLGIDGRRAHEILVEVEAQAARGGGRDETVGPEPG